MLHQLATLEECAQLREEASAAADTERTTAPSKALAEWGPGRIRRSVIDLLGSTGQALSDTLLMRAVASIEQRTDGLIDGLFEGKLLPGMSVLHHPGLIFTENEPAINVYTEGGNFEPHKDHQSLTILLLLSDEQNFTGGGTGFWAKDNRIERSDGPSVVLTPSTGTALLFGERVMHAGQPVLSGERCVLVASFSLNKDMDS